MRTILVDDEPFILEKLEHMLRQHEALEVVAAYTDPLQALEEVHSTRPDCAFLDIEMAGLNGIELAERLAAACSGLQVVFVTAYNHFASQAFDVNAIDYLLKPIRPERLHHAVNKLVQREAQLPRHPEHSCTIRCFGAFEVIVNHRPIRWSRSRARELLAYLLQHEGKWISKYKLCDELWPTYSPERALSYLQICLHALRKTLREAGCTQIVIDYSNNKYSLTVQTVDWDLRSFEEASHAFSTTGSPEAAERALRWCRAEYMEGEDWLWASLPRESYIIRYDRLKQVIEEEEEVEEVEE
ncbi:response regulator [Paenibacillus sp. SYP-B4298]|uniref:response regulator n=1 Tax=Paenibacillus sp. SYP-B4298 TaxID=2996034 RepID=UPI0022DD27B3|nr:response regulator [Paenibacillus sp. SYP-B4298]